MGATGNFFPDSANFSVPKYKENHLCKVWFSRNYESQIYLLKKPLSSMFVKEQSSRICIFYGLDVTINTRVICVGLRELSKLGALANLTRPAAGDLMLASDTNRLTCEELKLVSHLA